MFELAPAAAGARVVPASTRHDRAFYRRAFHRVVNSSTALACARDTWNSSPTSQLSAGAGPWPDGAVAA
ncbi:MAG: hypothetical protein WBD07_16655 [Vicinamibacterales bacterium]